MISSAQPTRGANLSTRPRNEITARRRRTVLIINHILDVALVAAIVAITLYFLDDSHRATSSPARPTGAMIQSVPNAQRLPSDPRDPAVSSDLVIVRKLRDVIARELTAADARLHSGMPRQHDVRLRYSMGKMLSNAGGTGLDDRIAEIEAAIRLRKSPTYDANRDQSSIRQAIRNLHDTAISCRSGALATAVAKIHNTPEASQAVE